MVIPGDAEIEAAAQITRGGGWGESRRGNAQGRTTGGEEEAKSNLTRLLTPRGRRIRGLCHLTDYCFI